MSKQEILIYSTENCPNCKILKRLLEQDNIEYKNVNMSTPEALTELRMNSVFTMSAPVLQIGKRFYTTKDLFTQDRIDLDKVKDMIKEELWN